MPKFTFTCEYDHPIKKDTVVSKVTLESNREYLPDVLEDVRDFLKGCGFQIDGDIDVVENEPVTITCDFDSFATMNDPIITSSYGSDTITINTGIV